MKQAPYDVVIVGAGITGLALGLALHQGGLRVRVLEHAPLARFVPEPGFDSRIYALSRSSQAFLQQVGGWEQQDASRLQPILGMEIWGDRQGRLQFGAAQHSHRAGSPRAAPQAQGTIVEAGAMLEGLLRVMRVEAPDLVQVPETVLAVEHEPAGLLLRLQRGAPLRCALLVAADGVGSPVRAHMGVSATFKAYDHQALVANYRTSGPHGGLARQWFSAGEVLALLPLPGNHVSLVWSARKAHARRLLEKTPAQRMAAIEGVIGPSVEAGPEALAAPQLLEELTTPQGFDLRLMRPDTLVLPRFALVGDAAHGVHPMAGQGLNLGLQDAATLATVLLHRGWGPDCGDWSLLRRYARARQEPIALMQGLTDGLYRLFDSEQWGLPLWRNWGMNRVNQWGWLKNRLMAHANTGSQ